MTRSREWMMKKHLILFTRKLGSVLTRSKKKWNSASIRLGATLNASIKIQGTYNFGKGVELRATDGGIIQLGKRVSIGRNAVLIAQGGEIVIGDDCYIGDGSFIVAKEAVSVGSGTLIAEYVVIRDQDHSIDSLPIRLAGFETAPIEIGDGVWVGCKATILRGVRVGDGAVIGAHALVRSNISDGMLAVGLPAKAVRCLRNTA